MEGASVVDGVTGQILQLQGKGGGEAVRVEEVLRGFPERSVWEVEVGKRGKELAPTSRLEAGKLYLMRPSSSLKRSLCEEGLWGATSSCASAATHKPSFFSAFTLSRV